VNNGYYGEIDETESYESVTENSNHFRELDEQTI
jgi:hypothetical protein